MRMGEAGLRKARGSWSRSVPAPIALAALKGGWGTCVDLLRTASGSRV